jgi:hypothetical protein
MSVKSYNQYVMLSDSLERDLMREALSCGETLSLADIAKSIGSGLKKVLIGFAQFADDTSNVLARSRVYGVSLSNSQR